MIIKPVVAIPQECIDEISALAEKATPGPWEVVNGGWVQTQYVDEGKLPERRRHYGVCDALGHYADKTDDSAFIAASRQAVPDLIAEIKRLQAENALLRGAMDAQDERERQAGIACGIPYAEHGCDWPDSAADTIVWLRHVIACVRSVVDDVSGEPLRSDLENALRGLAADMPRPNELQQKTNIAKHVDFSVEPPTKSE